MTNVGKNWLIGVINTGQTQKSNDTHIVTTDDVHGSACITGDAEADAKFIAAARNHFVELFCIADHAAHILRHDGGPSSKDYDALEVSASKFAIRGLLKDLEAKR